MVPIEACLTFQKASRHQNAEERKLWPGLPVKLISAAIWFWVLPRKIDRVLFSYHPIIIQKPFSFQYFLANDLNDQNL